MIRRQLDTFLRRFEREFDTHNRVEVSALALQHNVQLFEKLTKLPVIPVLKANAYGHGIAQVAKALDATDVPYIAVDAYFEALKVRAGTTKPVLIMRAI